MLKRMLLLSIGLLIAGQALAGDMAYRVPPPTRPLYGEILTISLEGDFVVFNSGIYRWSSDGIMNEIPTPLLYGKILSVDDNDNILAFNRGLYVYKPGGNREGEQIHLQEKHIIGKPFAATINGDLFTINAGSILWYTPSGDVLEADQGAQQLWGTPISADTKGNIYMKNGGDIYRYNLPYKPTKLFN